MNVYRRQFMRIEIDHKGSEAFYKEIVNVVAQYKNLIRKPERRYTNYIKILGIEIIVAALFAGIQLGFILADGPKSTDLAVLAFLVIVVVMGSSYYFNLTKMYKNMMAEEIPSVLTLDEEGVELEKVGSQTYRMNWNTIAFVRVFEESVCFISGKTAGLVIGIERAYEDQILDYLTDHCQGVKVIRQ